MKKEIKDNLDNPEKLERLYRDNKVSFKKEFNLIFSEIKENPTARIWNARLNFEREEISWGTRTELILVITASLLAGLIAKIPDFTGMDEEYFYSRNIGFIVFPFLASYFAWKHKSPLKNRLIVFGAMLISIVYINMLPDSAQSDTLILASIHLPLFLWSALGFTFLGDKLKDNQRRLNYLSYNADLVVMTTLILIAGMVLTGITLGLFELIEVHIEEIYFEYVVVWGLAAAPLVGTYLVQSNPQLVNKVSPVIAKVFTPLVLVMLVVYLVTIITTGKDPYNDREFLLIFNVLLIGVMALILFAIVGTSKSASGKVGIILLLALSIVTVIVNTIALSAILYRISEWGISPNRLAVLGGNLLILTNLLLVAYRLFKAAKDKNEMEKVSASIVSFLPVYSLWTIVVTFIFPVLFSFK